MSDPISAFETAIAYHQPEYVGCPISGVVADQANDRFCYKYSRIWIAIRIFLSLYDFCGDILFAFSFYTVDECDENNYYTIESAWPLWIAYYVLGIALCAFIGFLCEFYVIYNYIFGSNNDRNGLMNRDILTYMKVATQDVFSFIAFQLPLLKFFGVDNIYAVISLLGTATTFAIALITMIFMCDENKHIRALTGIWQFKCCACSCLFALFCFSIITAAMFIYYNDCKDCLMLTFTDCDVGFEDYCGILPTQIDTSSTVDQFEFCEDLSMYWMNDTWFNDTYWFNDAFFFNDTNWNASNFTLDYTFGIGFYSYPEFNVSGGWLACQSGSKGNYNWTCSI